VYAFILLVVGLHASRKHGSFSYLAGVPLAIATMHIFWGSGFLASAITAGLGNNADG
jgi:hypothetical protein